MEKRLNQSLRYLGVETMIPSDDDSATDDGESSSVEQFSSYQAGGGPATESSKSR